MNIRYNLNAGYMRGRLVSDRSSVAFALRSLTSHVLGAVLGFVCYHSRPTFDTIPSYGMPAGAQRRAHIYPPPLAVI